jgi:hypothetical protein
MKTYIVALFAVAASLAIAPAAFGDVEFSFTYTGVNPPDEIATGTLFGTEIGTTGDYQLNSGTITITGLAFSGTGTLDVNAGDMAGYGADNELYLAGDAADGRLLSGGGLLFSTTNGLNNLWGGDNNNNGLNTSYSLSGNSNNFITYPGTFGTLAISGTPDGGTTLAFLGLAIVGMAGIRRKLSL